MIFFSCTKIHLFNKSLYLLILHNMLSVTIDKILLASSLGLTLYQGHIIISLVNYLPCESLVPGYIPPCSCECPMLRLRYIFHQHKGSFCSFYHTVASLRHQGHDKSLSGINVSPTSTPWLSILYFHRSHTCRPFQENNWTRSLCNHLKIKFLSGSILFLFSLRTITIRPIRIFTIIIFILILIVISPRWGRWRREGLR